MTLDQFKDLCASHELPPGLPGLLQSLWYERTGNWAKAHQIAQQVSTSDGSWVHAYLHRVEGDLGNARYWYSRAGRPEASASLDTEWETIADYLLSGSTAIG